MTKLPSFMETKKEEMAAAVSILKALLNNPENFGKIDEAGATDLLAGRLITLEQQLAALELEIAGLGLSGDVDSHYHSSDRNLADSIGQLPLLNNSAELLDHVNNAGSINPHNITYLILGNDLDGMTLTNAGQAINPTDVPNLQQIQALIETTLEYSDLTIYEPAFDKNTAFNKNFGSQADTVAEGNHNHDANYSPLTHNHDANYAPLVHDHDVNYEPVFAKNTAFNKDFGTQADTVAEGNHNHNADYSAVGHDHSADYEPTFAKNTAFNKDFGTQADTVAEGNHNHDTDYAPAGDYASLVHEHDANYEPIFTKNTAFNKDFGTIAGTVAEGNHTHEGIASDDHNHDSSYEPVFAKNTAFNKNFGTQVDTVAEGNHDHDASYANISHDHDGLYASLVSGKISMENIPDALLGQVKYQGIWNAATNTPTLPLPADSMGFYFVTSESGNYAGKDYMIGDWIISDGTQWDRVKNTDAVRTVFGELGDITAQAGHYAAFYEPVFTKNTAFNKDFGTQADTVAEGNHNHDADYSPLAHNHNADYASLVHDHDVNYEPIFAKNTAFNKDFGTQADTVAEGNHNHDADYAPAGDYASLVHEHDANYEPIFTKNTAFNKDFGTIAGTVAEGNHTHDFVFEDMNTAFNKNFGTTADTVAEGNHNHDADYSAIGHDHNAEYETKSLSGSMVLAPEFANCVMDALGEVNHIGTMTTGHDLVANYNYYQWTVDEITEQHYSIVSFVELPKGFTNWSQMSFWIKASDANNHVALSVYDAQGNNVYTIANQTNLNWTKITLDTAALASINAGNWTVNKQFKLVFTLTGNNGSAMLGHVELGYNKN